MDSSNAISTGLVQRHPIGAKRRSTGPSCRHLIAFLSLFLFCSAMILARIRDLTEKEARELVATGLGRRVTSLPKFGLDAYQSSIPPARTKDYFSFEATFDNPVGSVVIGHYGVHGVSGDVWELVVCKKLDSADLREMQRKVRQRIGLSSQELRAVADQPPPCPKFQ
jgi:hypothetical protein